MTNGRFDALFGHRVRQPDQLLTPFHMDIAASIQAVTEEIMLRLARSTRAETGMKNLCLAGGVALNCVANGKILAEGIYENIWVQPAAGDAGGSVGAALAAYHLHQRRDRVLETNEIDGMQGAYLGPAYDQQQVESEPAAGAKFTTFSDQDVIDRTAKSLSAGKAVGWMQGRMEFGPRALGNRSILGDPRSPTMQKMLNLKVKYRESFRPFAPSVLREDAADWFELDGDSPYMLLVADVRKERRRAMTHEEQSPFGIDSWRAAF
jgi:carbamoyltransferase